MNSDEESFHKVLYKEWAADLSFGNADHCLNVFGIMYKEEQIFYC